MEAKKCYFCEWKPGLQIFVAKKKCGKNYKYGHFRNYYMRISHFYKKRKKKFPKVAALLESGNTGFFFASLWICFRKRKQSTVSYVFPSIQIHPEKENQTRAKAYFRHPETLHLRLIIPFFERMWKKHTLCKYNHENADGFSAIGLYCEKGKENSLAFVSVIN